MHSLAWDNPDDEKDACIAIAKGEPGQVIDLPTPPDHIIVDIKPKQNIQWPQHLNTLAGAWAGGTQYGVNLVLLIKIVCLLLCVTWFPFVIFRRT